MAENSGRTARSGPRGRPFTKGVSGNPGGRPKVVGPLRELARQHTLEALEVLVHIMRKGQSDRARAAAAEAILDRGHGKPVAVDVRSELASGFERALEALRRTLPDEMYELALEAIATDDRNAGHGGGEDESDPSRP